MSDIETRDIRLSRQQTTKALIRLHGCTGWSAPLFAYGLNKFSHDVAHILTALFLRTIISILSIMKTLLYTLVIVLTFIQWSWIKYGWIMVINYEALIWWQIWKLVMHKSTLCIFLIFYLTKTLGPLILCCVFMLLFFVLFWSKLDMANAILSFKN